jgi:hypothetical protein
MNHCAFVSINRMRAGHSSIKVSLSRFNTVSTVEWKRGDGLQTEEQMFWGCKLYAHQNATMMDILSENTQSQLQSS